MIANVTIGRKIGGRNRYRFLISTKIINLVRKKSLNVNSAGILRIFVVVLDNLFDYQLFVENSHENGQRIRKCGTVW